LRLLYGVSGTELGILQDELQGWVGKRLTHGLACVSVDDNGPVRMQVPRAFEHVGEQRPAAEMVQDFRQTGMHARALACGEDDYVERGVFHLARREFDVNYRTRPCGTRIVPLRFLPR
jgi:hypothetical protein